MLVGAGCRRLAQTLLDFISWMHFIQPVHVVRGFDLLTMTIHLEHEARKHQARQ
jgi:hypothetical protein